MNEQFFHNTRVLIVDDNADIHADFKKLLSAPDHDQASELAALRAAIFGKQPAGHHPSFDINSAFQGEQAAGMVKAACDEGHPYAVAFIDMRMPPGWDGLRTIQELWRLDHELQIVICTAFTDHPWSAIEEVARGSDRLLILKKPFDVVEVKQLAITLCAKWTLARRAAIKCSELEQAVAARTAELELARHNELLKMENLVASVERRAEELRKTATHDELTGLPNRTLFHDRLSQALAQAARNPDFQVAVLFIDFDRFKLINDSLGHAAGDSLLKLIAQRLSGVLRATDTVSVASTASTAARLGGDEFCLLLSGLRRREDASLVAQRILAELSKPYQVGNRELASTASIGIAVSITGKERAEDLVRDADNAMYRAKAQGKGRFVMFDRAMHQDAMNRLTMESELARTLERNQLRTYFQPIVSLATGEILEVEALVRWFHPERGSIPPGEFIKIAEETGFIEPLGLWVLEEACTNVVRWRKSIASAAGLRVNVNVSNRQLYNAQFPAQVAAVLKKTGLPADALTLEITEHFLMANTDDVHGVLRTLRSLGVRIFLDDFGTGYSSLSMLHTFPLDGLKIDRSFILDSSLRRRFAAIIQTVMNLVYNLNMEGVAEGIESIEHVALLQALGCCKGQGYLFSPPASPDEIERLLRTNFRGWLLPNTSAA